MRRPDASEFSYFGKFGDHGYSQATMTPAPITPDIHQATVTSPTTLVSYIPDGIKVTASMELSHL